METTTQIVWRFPNLNQPKWDKARNSKFQNTDWEAFGPEQWDIVRKTTEKPMNKKHLTKIYTTFYSQSLEWTWQLHLDLNSFLQIKKCGGSWGGPRLLWMVVIVAASSFHRALTKWENIRRRLQQGVKSTPGLSLNPRADPEKRVVDFLRSRVHKDHVYYHLAGRYKQLDYTHH